MTFQLAEKVLDSNQKISKSLMTFEMVNLSVFKGFLTLSCKMKEFSGKTSGAS
jgi:hypothetical protein